MDSRFLLVIPVYCFLSHQSQQPLEDLDAKLRRTLSPETIPVTSAPACVRVQYWHTVSVPSVASTAVTGLVSTAAQSLKEGSPV
ncbi:hypothetical protein ASZ78_012095 [Callipepla squamata]|uniref:Uncharacterized protein n=1 Tax=Callipepla squamata TaxID=9009 RepID=A0A226MWR7_CALSU|nr:hypothetical protein ASZ78_012095 [Callipepla squamata]